MKCAGGLGSPCAGWDETTKLVCAKPFVCAKLPPGSTAEANITSGAMARASAMVSAQARAHLASSLGGSEGGGDTDADTDTDTDTATIIDPDEPGLDDHVDRIDEVDEAQWMCLTSARITELNIPADDQATVTEDVQDQECDRPELVSAGPYTTPPLYQLLWQLPLRR